VVHPRATIGPNVKLGEGNYVEVGAVLTADIQVARFATINTHCDVAHDGTDGDGDEQHLRHQVRCTARVFDLALTCLTLEG